MGTESAKAWATPPYAFSAPEPYCIANTPMRRPFDTRLKPSAMFTPARSWRQMNRANALGRRGLDDRVRGEAAEVLDSLLL